MKKCSILRGALLVCLLVFFAPLVMSAAHFSLVVSPSLQHQAESSVSFAIRQLTESLHGKLSMLNNTAYYLMSNDPTQQVMTLDAPTRLQISQMEQQVNSALTFNVAWSDQFIQSLYLFKEDGSAYATTRESIYAGVRGRCQAIYEHYIDFSSTRTLLRPEGANYAYYIQDYYDIDVQKKAGKLLIEIDVNKLIGKGGIADFYSDGVVILSNTQGDILCCMGAEGARRDALLSIVRGESEAADGDYYHQAQAIGKSQLQLDLFIPYGTIQQPVLQISGMYIVFGGAFLLIGILVSGLLYAALHRVITRWQTEMGRLARGDFEASVSEKTRYLEFNQIAHSFNNASRKLATLFDEVYEKGVLLNQAEYQMLEAQINPHFIMNVLETINMRCLMAGQQETSEMVVNLGMLLKNNILMKNKQKVSLRQELEYTRYYLALQKSRFGGRLRFSISVEDDALMDCLLPKLTIQPIVENSVVHGVEGREKGGEVHLSIWEEEGELCIRVVDDGVGFDSSSVNLREGGDTTAMGHTHIALKNIQRRIELLYGSKWGITIASKPGEGTSVMISLPLDRPEETKTC